MEGASPAASRAQATGTQASAFLRLNLYRRVAKDAVDGGPWGRTTATR
jgi:hypothetical protein